MARPNVALSLTFGDASMTPKQLGPISRMP